MARVLLAAGGVGAIVSLAAMAVTYVAARDRFGTAADVFYWSGYTLCVAAVALYVSRRIGAPDD